MSDPQQLLLGLQSNREAEFDNFFCSRDLKLVHATLRRLISRDDDDNIYLSGLAGAGKSHLLQAICHEASLQKRDSTVSTAQSVTRRSSKCDFRWTPEKPIFVYR